MNLQQFSYCYLHTPRGIRPDGDHILCEEAVEEQKMNALRDVYSLLRNTSRYLIFYVPYVPSAYSFYQMG